jgi:hypothetical protein
MTIVSSWCVSDRGKRASSAMLRVPSCLVDLWVSLRTVPTSRFCCQSRSGSLASQASFVAEHYLSSLTLLSVLHPILR